VSADDSGACNDEKFRALVLQKFFTFESVSFNYKAERKSSEWQRETIEEGKLEFAGIDSYRNSRKEFVFTNYDTTSKIVNEAVINGHLYNVTRGIDALTNQQSLVSNGLIDKHKHYAGVALILYDILRTPFKMDLQNQSIKFAYVKTNETPFFVVRTKDNSSEMYFSPSSGLLMRMDFYKFGKTKDGSICFVSERFILDKYVQKNGFYFPTKITEMQFRLNSRTYLDEKPIGSIEAYGKKFLLIKGQSTETAEYDIDEKSLTFGTVKRSDLKITFPPGCLVRDNIEKKAYVIGADGATLPSK